jgi:hypothetical protein
MSDKLSLLFSFFIVWNVNGCTQVLYFIRVDSCSSMFGFLKEGHWYDYSCKNDKREHDDGIDLHVYTDCDDDGSQEGSQLAERLDNASADRLNIRWKAFSEQDNDDGIGHG